jgi:hypothetical protein
MDAVGNLQRLRSKIVAVTFWDHSIKGRGAQDAAPMKFTVFGEVASVSKLFMRIRTWKMHTRDKDLLHNEEIASICLSTIIEIKLLRG